MLAILRLLAALIANLFKSRRRLEAENLFLRHQLNIAVRRRPLRLPLRGTFYVGNMKGVSRDTVGLRDPVADRLCRRFELLPGGAPAAQKPLRAATLVKHHRIIPRSRRPKLSNTIIQKGLALDRHWSGTGVTSGAHKALCPAGLMAEVGLRWCGGTPRHTERRISMTKSAKKQSVALPAKPVPSATSSEEIAQVSEGGSADPGSKQARLIAMLQSPSGATIAAMMDATGWQQHSVRGFLAGVVRKRLKLKLISKKVDGARVYQIASTGSGKVGSRSSKRRSR
jgi:hypothetical protein